MNMNFNIGTSNRKYPGGAVASIGATWLSANTGNGMYDKEAFRQFCIYDNYRIGKIHNAGTKYVIEHITNPKVVEQNMKIYLLLGDPATEIWTDVPKNLTVNL